MGDEMMKVSLPKGKTMQYKSGGCISPGLVAGDVVSCQVQPSGHTHEMLEIETTRNARLAYGLYSIGN